MKGQGKMAKEKVKENDIYIGCYGDKLKPSKAKEFIIRNIKDNLEREKPFAINMWGSPGCGKTSIVKDFCKESIEWNGKVYEGIKVIDVPLAQIEEMGEICGLPETFVEMEKDGNTKWFMKDFVGEMLKNGWMPTDKMPITKNAPPSWVPIEECPGIILFDDGNRAGQRIMKGLMQLVQDGRTISWSLPKGWTIIFTGNPDNRWNQVTSMDSAQLTRMKHITLEPDAKEWAKWATEVGLDERGINFILKYPEMMIGSERTNPRTLSEFFHVLKRYPKKLNSEDLSELYVEARSLLDEETVETMMVFFLRDVELVISPEMILEENDKALKELKQLMNREEPRVDIINIVNDRLIAYLCSSTYEFESAHIKSVQNWMLSNDLPKDTSYGFIRSILLGGCKEGKKFISGNKDILKLVEDTYKFKG